ncbi:methyltransferase [Nadsonia fulvescens var. elongata DSM 6958]|uniref:tRNA N(3)-methylcytidine methyltransferase n=1 Tax=Nadsonia fulvescens var. elongata DSM 6958 TaxID=857566 RepID=A0A1E3PP23_9ASCO|nr:methyltransferase [Nadsonia fulvescens var. elongata DSM 6958]
MSAGKETKTIDLAEQVSLLEITPVGGSDSPQRPYEFGQRVLTDEDKVWDHNAWDHVEWGEEQRLEAEEKLVKQKEAPVKEFDKKLYMGNPAKYWDQFYRHNEANFFKDRKWLKVEFPQLYELTRADAGKRTILEVGCGAGNTLFPVLETNENPLLKAVGADFSSKAVQIVRESPKFDPKHAVASVWDLANTDGALPEGVEENECDIIVMIFVFSALSPDQWAQAMNNLNKALKPGGLILFRDYGRYDLTQLRFKGGRLLDENFYIRGDGTRVYFFTEEELHEIFGGKFDVLKVGTDRRLMVNRQRKIKMYRIWLQASFQKPLDV